MNEHRPGNFTMLPTIVKNLLIINGLFFLASFTLQSVYRYDLVDILGMHYIYSEKFKPYQLFTYMFMHGDITHIFFNMFALWMFGKTLETVWGPKKFLIYYLVTGIGAVFIHSIVVYFEISPVMSAIDEYLAKPSTDDFKMFMESENFKVVSADIHRNLNAFIETYNSLLKSSPDRALSKSIDFMQQYRIDYQNAPVVVGASGAVFGILLAFGMLFPNSVIYLYFAIPIKAKYFVMIYGAAELFMGVSNQSGDNVAHFAHLGGMIFGFILIKYWQKQNNNKPWIS